MTEHELNINQNTKNMYLKEELIRVLGGFKAMALAHVETILLYPPDVEYSAVLESLEIIKKDLELRKKREENG